MDSYSDACMAIVADNIKSIFKNLQLNARYPTDVCRSMNLCNIQVKVCCDITLHDVLFISNHITIILA